MACNWLSTAITSGSNPTLSIPPVNAAASLHKQGAVKLDLNFPEPPASGKELGR